MKREEFNEAFKILESVFGSKAYPTELKELLFMKLGRLSYDAFSKVCNRLACSSRYRPLYDDFEVLLIEQLRDMRANQIEQIKESYTCSTCNSSGVLTVLLKWGEADVAGRCWCRFGELLYQGLPLMNRKFYFENKPKEAEILSQAVKLSESQERAKNTLNEQFKKMGLTV